ncbi:cupin domain-containing protein [Amycolatopsis sp. PS_44_ISF1]|uniref:cupin domain-containing protein n=1 Tax=Amycolatopsis sp. PS_44_ISF1 TaxID=2974917 RepID=UPI0028DE8EBB|nr:cupin domain-containing protein [Amycolatopsis sp. PS_44_ISF1]MDT8912751.1 cupin domain-containing protein [Amycolatopsis sp. PS_44_ISF1]
MSNQSSSRTGTTVEALTDGLALRPDPRGGRTGPALTHLFPSVPVLARTRLLAPGQRSAWCSSTSDTLLFFHTGEPLRLSLREPAGDASTVVLGADPSYSTPQWLVPAGTGFALAPESGGFALWSQASMPGGAEPAAQAQPLAPLPDHQPGRKPGPEGSLAAGFDLERHIEGGYFRQTYESGAFVKTPRGDRPVANSIIYLLDQASPVGHLHSNVPDITHFLHSGGPIRYRMLAPDGVVHEQVLGFDVAAGEVPVLTCPGGWWKTSMLPPGVGHGLISEVVAPGFRYEDQELLTLERLTALFPDRVRELAPYVSRH